MNSIIDNSDERNNLLEYLFNKKIEEQKKFINDFYAIFFVNNDYIVNSKIVQKWVIYSDKNCFKRFFEAFLKEDEDFCKYKTKGKNEEFMFTLKAFNKMLYKYDDTLKLVTYLSELERDIKDYYILYKEKLHNIEKNKLLEETERLCDNKKAVIYIYNTDTRNKNKIPTLKIGLTENLQERVRTYTTSHPNGLIVYQEEIFKNSLKLAEKWLHHLLTEAGYLVKSECFELSIEEAILWIKLVNNDLKITKIKNKCDNLSEIISKEMYIIDNIVVEKTVLHYDISIQTDAIIEEIDNTEDENQLKALKIVKEPPKNIASFNKFIEECCVLDRELEVSSVDIIGKYRIWSQNASKEVYLDLLDYLKDAFKPIRIQIQDKNNVVNGFRGIGVKKQEDFKLSISASKYELFLFSNCNLSPSYKTLFSDIKDDYISWRKNLENNVHVSDTEIKELKYYLNDCNFLLKSNVWTDNGNGSGFYGLSLKKFVIHPGYITSSTAKRVEKIDVTTCEVITSWNTIAKAASFENIPAARMSRLCKRKEIINDLYYYRSV